MHSELEMVALSYVLHLLKGDIGTDNCIPKVQIHNYTYMCSQLKYIMICLEFN